MPRIYKKKGTRTDFNEADMEQAIKDATEHKLSLRRAAEKNNVRHTALFYRIKNKDKNIDYAEKYSTNKIFNSDEEYLLKMYLLKSSKINYGLTYVLTRKLAYEYALKLDKKLPNSWNRDKMAGIEWMKGYMRRHEELSLRKPENTSLSRATSFNETNVDAFQNNYCQVMEKFSFTEERIYNLDETGVMTVVQAPYIIAARGIKQVVSGERGKLVTMCAIISASGNPIPPVFVYPRARMIDSLLTGAPSGSVGYPNSPESGWMTANIFLKVLEHLKKYSRCSRDDPILLLMDNHESHCSLEAIVYSKENGIVLTFPPHCSHRLQPLDVGVLGPFKAKFKVACNDWMLNHPGRTITIHNIAEIVGIAYARSFTINNIKEAFKKPGIWPVNRNAFTDEDFDASYVTDRPLIDVTNVVTNNTTNDPAISLSNLQAGCSKNTTIITPESIKPFPKVTEQRKQKQGKKKGTSKILTDTPVKNQLEEELILRISTKVMKNVKRQNKNVEAGKTIMNIKKKNPKLEDRIVSALSENTSFTNIKQKSVKRKVLVSDSSSSSESTSPNISVHDSSYGEESFSDIEQLSNTEIKCKDFILVKLCTKKSIIHYVAQVEDKFETDLFVNFLKKTGNTFSFPETADKSLVSIDDVIIKLPQPSVSGGTIRAAKIYVFHNFDFSMYSMR